jgi:hypothetical protein
MQRNGFNIICITASKKIYSFVKNISVQKQEKIYGREETINLGDKMGIKKRVLNMNLQYLRVRIGAF